MYSRNVVDDYTVYLLHLMDETKRGFYKTYMTEEIRERRKQQAIDAQKFIQEIILQVNYYIKNSSSQYVKHNTEI